MLINFNQTLSLLFTQSVRRVVRDVVHGGGATGGGASDAGHVVHRPGAARLRREAVVGASAGGAADHSRHQRRRPQDPRP